MKCLIVIFLANHKYRENLAYEFGTHCIQRILGGTTAWGASFSWILATVSKLTSIESDISVSELNEKDSYSMTKPADCSIK